MSEVGNNVSSDWRGMLLNKARSLSRSGINSFNLWHQRQNQDALEKELARIIETANGHQAKGLPKGSPAYVVLREKADASIQAFAKKWNVDIATIEAQAPALADLQSLCVPDKKVPRGLKLILATFGTVLFLVLIGAGSGLVQAGHDCVMRVLGLL
jgi:hypothetical protein